MKAKEQWYAVIGGCVGAVLTLVVCSFFPLGAQSQSDVNFGKITCTELEVLRPDGRGGALIGVNEHGGIVYLVGQDGELKVHISTDEHGGIVSVGKKSKQLAVGLGIDKHGGGAVMAGKDGKVKVVMGVDEFGNGEVVTWDKNGFRLK